jgi:hypothetical protein
MRYPSDRKQKFLRTSLSLIGFVSALVFCCQRTVRESSGSLFPDNEISPTLRKGAFLFLPLIFPCTYYSI